MPKEKRVYADPSLEAEQLSAHGFKYFQDRVLTVDTVEDYIVLPLRQERVDARGAKFSGGIIDEKMKFYAPSAHVHDLNGELGSLKEGYAVELATVVRDDRTVIWGGVLFDHFGHFLCESLNRLWYAAQYPEKKYPVVFICEKARKISSSVRSLLELLGISDDRLILIDRPTRFARIIVPEQSSVLTGFYTKEFVLPFQKMATEIEAEPFKKVYFSRRKFKGGIKIFGEDKLERVFKANGYKVVYPERLSLKEQIAYVKGAKEMACVMGSAAHLSLFAAPKTKLIVLERTEHINKEQILINQAMELDWYSVGANMNYLPVGHEFSPILMGITDQAAAFFTDHGFKFNPKDVNRISDRYVRRFNQSWLSRYSSYKHNSQLEQIPPVYVHRLRLYCQTAFLSLRQRLFMKRTEGDRRVWSILGFSFKTKRHR